MVRELFENAEARARLKVAFEILNRKGIKTEANFMCCQSCGSAAMVLTKEDRGGVFWHDQDDEHFHEHGELRFAFFTEDGEGALQIGKDLVEALTTVGFDVEWSGSSDQRPAIKAKPAGRFDVREAARGLEPARRRNDEGEED